MAESFEVTAEWINDHRTPAGGFKCEQLRTLGVAWPPKAGWPARAEGKVITQEQRLKFESFHHGFKATKKSKAVMGAVENPLLPMLRRLLKQCNEMEERLGICSDQSAVIAAIAEAESGAV